ncbi:hypothetical protein DRW07_03980 [Alteromonas sediminis]|uniref:Heme NO-binding domain-containing protein n=1 Tax=Alteromonas sediminis TaxID=2259342 RepID=A0A3N5Y4P9_9ALTE|nr:heme NO-binding domain-containing protein [Alteromonas sediminis]RPJ68570.1 hypothetical protein DRW07_03980 [Alteromonas sediminis]
MKGIIFYKFNRMVETVFGADMLEQVLSNSHLASEGIYTVNGYYSHDELVEQVRVLSELTEMDVSQIIFDFGVFLFGELVRLPSPFMSNYKDAFTMIADVDSVIHPEVQRQHPDANLPRFETLLRDEKTLKIVYRSSRHFDDLAHGLMQGCLNHFGEKASIKSEPYQSGTLFILSK